MYSEQVFYRRVLDASRTTVGRTRRGEYMGLSVQPQQEEDEGAWRH